MKPARQDKYIPKDLDVAAFRAKVAGWAEMGKAQEIPADIEPFGESRARSLATINAHRAELGIEPLENDEVGNPELTEKRRRRSEAYHREEQRKRELEPERFGLSRRR